MDLFHRAPGIENGAAQFFLSSRRGVNIEPKTDHRGNDCNSCQGNTNARNTYPVGSQRDQFVVRRQSPEDQQDRCQQAPWNRENERERQYVRDEGDQVFHRYVVVDQERQQFSENVSDDEHQAQHRDREQDIHNELAANKSIDQLHLWRTR